MKRFRFSLEAVQTVREREATAALERYARAVRAQTEAETALRVETEALTDLLQNWRKAMNNRFRPLDAMGLEHTRAVLEARRNERAQALRDASAAAARALSEFQLARQKSEVVERFHDRKRREFNLAALKEEQHFMDELATTRRGNGALDKEVAYA